MLESTFGHDGALVSAARSSNSSEAVVLQSVAAVVALKRVIEKPGPFKEVSKAPEYIFVGLISHFDPGKYQHDSCREYF